MKVSVAFLCSIGLASAFAQWDVPVRIELNGDQPADKQVLGLADPSALDAAVSLDAARSMTMSYASATGTSAITATLFPAPASYTPGMAVTIVPGAANEANATLDLNGLGPVPIVKWGAIPLDSADLLPDIPARLVHDGSSFQLIASTYRACPQGTRAVGPNFCISDSSYGSSTFYEAVIFCRNMDARLCSFSEWIQSCRTDPGFVGTVFAGEWVDHAANSAADAKQMGYGSTGSGDGDPFGVPSCQHGRTAVPTTSGRIRCCRNR